MKQDPDIVRELRQEEKIGLLFSESQNYCEDLTSVGKANEEMHDRSIALFKGEDYEDDGIESKDIYKSLIENAPFIITTIDKKYNILNINHIDRGLKKNDVIGKKVFNFIEKDYHKILKDTVDSVFKTGKKGSFESKALGPDGSISWYNNVAGPILRNDVVIAVSIFGIDITDKKKAVENIRQSIEKYQKLVMLSPDGIITMSMKGKITSINKSFSKLTGFSEDEIVGKHFTKIGTVKAKDIPKYVMLFSSFLTGKKFPKFEFIYYHKNGEKRWGECYNSFLKNENNKNEIQLILKDITEHKIIQESLNESKQQLQTIIDNAKVGITILQDNRLVFNNQYVLDYLGYTQEEYNNLNFIETIHPDDREDIIKRIKLRYSGNKDHIPYESRVITKDGSIKWIEADSNLINWKGKTALQALFIDITDRKETDLKIRESEEKYRNLVENSKDAIVIIDLKGNIKFFNEASKGLTGYKNDKDIPDNVRKIIPIKYWPRSLKAIKMAKRGLQVPYYETKIIRKDGKIIDVETGGQAIFKDGKPVGIQIITRDISERKKQEKEIIKQRNKAQKYLDIAEVMIVAINKNGEVTLINNKGCEILGYGEKEIIGKNWFDNFIPERIRVDVRPVSKKLFSGKIHPFEYFENPVLTKNGEERLIAWHNSIIKDEKGKIIGHLSSGEDITTRKKVEERIKNIIKSSPSGILTVDPEGKITSWSPKCKDIFGWSEEEVIGKFNPTVPNNKRAKDLFFKTIKEEHTNLELKVLNKGKSMVDISLSTAPLFDNKGRFIGALGILTDITEKKIAEEKIKNILESSPDSITVTDLNGIIIECNEATLKLYGFSSKNKIIGKNALLFFPEKEKERALENLKKTLKKGSIKNIEYVSLRKNGTEFPIELSASVIKDNSGNPVAFVAIAKDISERKKVEEELRIANEKFKKIYEEASDGIVILDFKGKILELNKKALKIFGGKREEIIGTHFSKAGTIPLKSMPKLMKTFSGMIGGDQKPINVWIKNKKGKKIYLENSGTIIKLDGKKRIMVITRDITEKKKYEEVKINTQRKIEKQNIKLIKLDKIKTEFLNTTSHELRTPMASIKGYIQMLMSQKLGNINKEQNEALNVVLRNTNRLDSLIEDILDISRLESGTMKFIPDKTNINKMITEVIETMQPTADLKNIKINKELEKIPDIIIDSERIKNVLMNLIDNSIKFSYQDSIINLKTKIDKDDVLFEIQDFGRGIPKNKQKKIFDRFYQVDSGIDRKFGGVGLGLTISKGIVDAHGGKVWVKSKFGKGSSFIFSLPLNPANHIPD
jgi:PAS domain S-box-containing protein